MVNDSNQNVDSSDSSSELNERKKESGTVVTVQFAVKLNPISFIELHCRQEK